MRFRVNKTAFLFTNEECAVRCSVTDLSVGGARLALHASGQSVANAFSLLMAEESLLYPCYVCWQDSGLAGVSFTGQPELVGTPAEEIEQSMRESKLFRFPDE